MAGRGHGGRTVSLDRLNALHRVERDPDTGHALVTVGAGMRLHQLNQILAERGLAMQNLGDIDRQSIAGAISTGTHGTGAKFGGLATRVRALTVVGTRRRGHARRAHRAATTCSRPRGSASAPRGC